jgi:Flp pilus assembly protein CpaB
LAPSPPATRQSPARWLDLRLIGGILLVVIAVVVGASVVSDAQGGQLVWAAARDLPAGTVLRADDLTTRSVRLDDAADRYIDASAAPAGHVVVRSIGSGELVPLNAIARETSETTERLVSVPVEPNHFPSGLARGQRVDVYVVRGALPDSFAVDGSPEVVLQDVAVADVGGGDRGFGAAVGTVGVVLAVPAEDVDEVVAAVASGVIQLVLIPSSGP